MCEAFRFMLYNNVLCMFALQSIINRKYLEIYVQCAILVGPFSFKQNRFQHFMHRLHGHGNF